MTDLATTDEQVLKLAELAKRAAATLALLPATKRNEALESAAADIERCESAILEANRADVDDAEKLSKEGKLSSSLVSRLKLNSAKLKSVVEGIRQVASLPDPLGIVSYGTQLDTNLELLRISCPIGLIGVIFESRPDALPQIASLCLKSGNSVVLKGGREAIRTNSALFQSMRNGATQAGVPADSLVLLDSRKAVESLLQADRSVDLIIPRGSNALVRHIQDNTRIPVLGHADGICHVYVDDAADLSKAQRIVVDAKVQYAAACNAVETLLVHEKIASQFLPLVVESLRAESVEIRCDSRALAFLKGPLATAVSQAAEDDWSTEYCDLILSIKIVDSIDDAIAHINEFGSHHTDCIISENESAFDRFFAQVDSAGVYWNASTRFADGFRYGFGAEVGISTGKLHPRGPVGLDGLVTYKYKLKGDGHVVSDYVGDKARRFLHKSLDCNSSERKE